MNVGKTLFAQIMEFAPWNTFGRIIERHNGDRDPARPYKCSFHAWKVLLARPWASQNASWL
ncbi:MAG: DUF4372 domain-containing protein [Rhodanobacteraceae bacterium]